MKKLRTYDDFVRRVETAGFLPFSKILDNLPSLSDETEESQWHTGEPDTDPWLWKDRIASEKRAAFGCVLGGGKGFLSPRLYPYFLCAFQPSEEMEERWSRGLLKPAVWETWKQFEENAICSTTELHNFWRGSGKKGTSAMDGALRELQMQFRITVAGNRRKLDRYGQPCGWPSLLYERVDTWAPVAWQTAAENLEQAEAREVILSAVFALAPKADPKALERLFRFR